MDYARLRAAAMNGEDEEAVTVDTRALIDKVLARYSGEWTTLRELIQNAADAQATTVRVRWETLPSTQVPLPATTSDSDILRHVICHHTLRRLVVQNNGQPFSKTDWARLKKIAEGNPDETKIGAFGVGFYSVFADCEEPFVSSGDEAMAFYWKGNALFTKKVTLPPDQRTPDTTFVLEYRNTTTPLPNLLSVSQFLATSLTFVALQSIEFWIDDWKVLALQKKSSPSLPLAIPRDIDTQTKEGLMKVLTVERSRTQIDATFMSVIGWKPQTASSAARSNESYAPELSGLKSLFSRLTLGPKPKAHKEEQAVQDAILEDLTAKSTSVIFLGITSAQIGTRVSSSFAAELERATKKPPPKTTKIAILTASYDETVASEEASSKQASKIADVFASVLPSKKPGGRIFIGFPTTQTTGAGLHLSAPSVIPTVEREAIDLNARWVRTWNMEMLRAAGILSRLVFIDEMATLNQKLTMMSPSKDRKSTAPSLEDVRKCVPDALHILKTFSFGDSTPSAQVSQIVEEAFWTAYRHAAIEVFSSRGVLLSSKVRTSSDEIAKFVGGIPVVLNEMKEDPFMQRLIEFGLIEDITVEDICKELSAKALDKQQLGHFLQWITKSAFDGETCHADIQRLLDVAVATVTDGENGSSGGIIALGSIKNYLNNKIPPSLPIPPTTLPIAFTATIPENRLQALGWEPLGVVPWLRHLIESGPRGPPEQNLTKSDKFAHQVLTVLSKNWDNLSQGAKSSVISALQNIAVMPTKAGMKKPAESFFPTVRLFDDLPTLEGCSNLKEKFLSALGVRKTVDLETIHARLLTPSAADGGARWSNIELIKYLASVKDDIPAADMKKFRESPLCTAEAGPPGLESTKGTVKRYKVSELYEPKDSHRALGLPIIQWPGPPGSFRSNSAEGRFLSSLGLRPFPPVPLLVDMMASSDSKARAIAMQYFIGNHHINGYGAFDLSACDKCILPIEGGKEGQLVRPSACYTNVHAAVLGYSILRKDLHQDAAKFGVARDPPIAGCVERLVANPPKDRAMAITLFQYFATRIGDLDHTKLVRLRDAPIVPVERRGQRGGGEKRETTLIYVRPPHCYLGSSSAYKDIFDFVDFGPDANTFLFKCGAKSEPTQHEVAWMACTEPARVLDTLQSPDKYIDLLKRLREDFATLKSDKQLLAKMRTSPWLLGFRELASPAKSKDADSLDDEPPVKQYQLARPDEIVILDDYIAYRLFKETLLCAPEDDQLESFYQALGSQMLGSQVKQELRVGTPLSNQEIAKRLRKHVLERSKLFLHEYSKDKRDAVKHDIRWLEKNLQVTAVSSVTLRRSLQGHAKSHMEKQSAASGKTSTGWTLFVAAEGNKAPDMYQVGQAICRLLLARPNQHAYFFFEPFLKLDLLELRARGYNVDRILRAKEAEARLAEEERRKALEAEQARIREREKEWAAQQQQQQQQQQLHQQNHRPEESPATPVQRSRTRMPGAFDDSPEAAAPAPAPQPPRWGGGGGLFSTISRHLGFETDNDSSKASRDEINKFLPQSSESTANPGTVSKPTESSYTGSGGGDGGKITSPAAIQQNLLNAIRATRPHGSSHLFSAPQQTHVTEQSTYCDNTPAQNIAFLAEAPRGMRVFVARDLLQPGRAAHDRNAWVAGRVDVIARFEGVLRDVAGVYGLSEKAVHIFYDDEGGTIAFNSQGSVFCNLRFWEQLYDPQPRGAQRLEDGKRVEAAVWWWVVLAHELAHNLVGPHGSEHSYYTECFIQQYFPRMMAKAAMWMGSSAAAAAAGGGGDGGGAPTSADGAGAGSQRTLLPPPPPYSL
ncbi:hypothetical protein VTJ83DRAFT_3419 [Remersonia thermophila]|uniref:Sacsin/Nov domain-containing protein n=1 Tax=Remersonia thermophila TaxID=72144 RepID=A0ABR4DDX4_9PEZI